MTICVAANVGQYLTNFFCTRVKSVSSKNWYGQKKYKKVLWLLFVKSISSQNGTIYAEGEHGEV